MSTEPWGSYLNGPWIKSKSGPLQQQAQALGVGEVLALKGLVPPGLCVCVCVAEIRVHVRDCARDQNAWYRLDVCVCVCVCVCVREREREGVLFPF